MTHLRAAVPFLIRLRRLVLLSCAASWFLVASNDILYGLNLAPQNDSTSADRELADERYSKEELIAAVVDSLTSLESYDFVFTVQEVDGKTGQPLPQDRPIRRRIARDGPKWFCADIFPPDAQGQQDIGAVTFDGELRYSFTNTGLQPPFNEYFALHIHQHLGPPVYGPHSVLGTWLFLIERSLSEILTNCDTSEIELGGAQDDRYRLSIYNVMSTQNGLTYDLHVTIDPEKDFVPNEVLIAQPRDNVRKPGWKNHYKVKEFRRVIDEQSQRERAFPSVITFEQGRGVDSVAVINVKEVRINHSLPPELFTPELRPGALLSKDGIGALGRLEADDSLDREIDRLIAVASPLVPSRRMYWVTICAIIVVALLIVVIACRRYVKHT